MNAWTVPTHEVVKVKCPSTLMDVVRPERLSTEDNGKGSSLQLNTLLLPRRLSFLVVYYFRLITNLQFALLLLLLQATYLRAAKVNHIGESEARFSRS